VALRPIAVAAAPTGTTRREDAQRLCCAAYIIARLAEVNIHSLKLLHQLQENGTLFLSAFPMFVPSLAW
jgi:hypothetical protein